MFNTNQNINTYPQQTQQTQQTPSNFNLLSTSFNWTRETIQQKQSEMTSNIREIFGQNQNNKQLMIQAQLETLNINLLTIDKFFTPANIVMRKPKSVDQLFALSSNLLRDLQEKEQVREHDMANLFLSQNGVSLAKTEKDIEDLSKFVQSKYDLTTDLKRIPASEKYSFDDFGKYFQKFQTNNIRRSINEVVQYSEKKSRKTNKPDRGFYAQMIGQQYDEMGRVDSIRAEENVEMSYERGGYTYQKSNVRPYERTAERYTTDAKYGPSQRKFEQNINITPIKNKTFDTQMKVKTDLKQQVPLSTGVMLNNLSKSTNLLNINIEEKALPLFDTYFNTLKPYFLFKMQGKISQDTSGFLFNQTEINKFNEVKNKSNFIPVCISLNDLLSSFERSNDSHRRSLFNLLKHQLNPNDKSPLTVNKMLINTVSYYQNEFLNKILILQGNNNLDYNSKLRAVENYVDTIIYGKVLANNNNFFENKHIEELRVWGVIYYLIRSGLENECTKFVSNNKHIFQVTHFEEIYGLYLREEPLDYDSYASLLEFIKNKSENEINPFRHACYVLMSKVNQNVNEIVFESMEDYIWFYLKLIIEKTNYEKLKNERNLSAKFLTLREFQDYIKNYALESFKEEERVNPNLHLESLRCLFSLLLFEDGLNLLMLKKEYTDMVNISFLLREISILRNFNVNSASEIVLQKENIEEIINENLCDCDFMINKWMDTFTENFMHLRLFPILIYLKFHYRGDYLSKIANVLMSTGRYSVLLNLAELSFPFREIRDFKDKSYFLSDLLTETEISSVVSLIINNAVSSPPEVKANFDVLVKLAKKYKMHSELLELVINDCIEIITAKTPKKIFKPEIHAKPSIVNPSIKTYNDPRFEKSIKDKYKDILEEIGGNISQYDPKFKLNFKFLRQLETVEEIYAYLVKENYNSALDHFLKYVTLIPFKNDKDISPYMSGDYFNMNEQLKKIIPDVVYLLFYLLTRKVNEMNTSFNLKRNENMQNVKNDIDIYKYYIANLSNFIERLSTSRVLKNSEKYKEITRLMNDFSLKY